MSDITGEEFGERVKQSLSFSSTGMAGDALTYIVELEEANAHTLNHLKAAVAVLNERDATIAEQRATIEHLQRSDAFHIEACAAHQKHIDELEQITARLQSEIAELRTDAERYRWLRVQFNTWNVRHFISGQGWEYVSHKYLDAAIDAALPDTKGGEG